MRSEVSIEIAAPPGLVFALARETDRWERLLPHYVRSRVVARRADGETVVDFVARRPLVGILGLGLPVAWRARTWSEPATRRLRFVHVAGATRGMDVTWRIEPAAADESGADASPGDRSRGGAPGGSAPGGGTPGGGTSRGGSSGRDARDDDPGGTTRITIEHDFAPRIPGVAAFVDLGFTRPIAGRTLATFKALAEALATDWPATDPATSEAFQPADTTDPSS
jgi:hypothetical protein